MDFRIDAVLPATASQLWAIFFDVQRVAALIPGCENVVEVEKLKEFSAVLKQKIGPFKLEVPTRITIDSYDLKRQVSLKAAGSDKFTGTTIDVGMDVTLEEQPEDDSVSCKLGVSATMQVAGRLASLGYPIVRKRSEELFAEFERRLRAEISNPGDTRPAEPTLAAPENGKAPVATRPTEDPTQIEKAQPRATSQQAEPRQFAPVASVPKRGITELVLLWPRLGINVAAAIGVAHGAVAFGQSPWWWLVAPLLGVAASLGPRGS